MLALENVPSQETPTLPMTQVSGHMCQGTCMQALIAALTTQKMRSHSKVFLADNLWDVLTNKYLEAMKILVNYSFIHQHEGSLKIIRLSERSKSQKKFFKKILFIYLRESV